VAHVVGPRSVTHRFSRVTAAEPSWWRPIVSPRDRKPAPLAAMLARVFNMSRARKEAELRRHEYVVGVETVERAAKLAAVGPGSARQLPCLRYAPGATVSPAHGRPVRHDADQLATLAHQEAGHPHTTRQQKLRIRGTIAPS